MSTQDNASICAAMVRDFDFPRYAASLFAPTAQRRAMLALAAFDLEVQRIPDQVSQPLPGEVRLQWWADALEGTEHGGVAGHPVAAEMLRAIDTYALPRAPLLALIAAHKFDLYDDPMPNVAALEAYCDDTVGSLIGMNAALLSDDVASRDTIRSAGRAHGIARMLVRLPHDAAHRRCLLPTESIAAHGVARHQLWAGEDTPGIRAARGDLIATARRWLGLAKAGFKSMPRVARPALLPLATVGKDLDALQNIGPFALVPPPSRLRVLSSQWWMMR